MELDGMIERKPVSSKDSLWVSLINTGWKALPYCLLLTPLIMLLPFLNQFPYPGSGAPYSDLTITHYPNAIFLLDSLHQWGTIPLWSGTILSSYPFFANPLSGLWYPPGWLALIMPLPLGFNLLVGLHLAWGGWGLYRLMRLEGLSKPAALLSGLTFACLPKLFAHFGAGHLTLLYAVPWTPWLLGCQVQSPVLSLRRLHLSIPPGLILALIFLADPRWALYAGCLWWAYALARRNEQTWTAIGKKLILQTGLAGLLAAPLALPLLEYTRLSTRSALQASDFADFSLPISNLMGLLFPNPSGYHEFTLYIGGFSLILMLVVWLVKRPLGRSLFWSVVLGISLLYALGGNIPGFEQLANLPGLDLLRVPSRALFISGLAMASLVGYGIDSLLQPLTTQDKRKLRLGIFAVLMLTLCLALGYSLLAGQIISEIMLAMVFLLLAALWIGLWLSQRIPQRWWYAGVIGLSLLNLAFVDLQSFKPRPVTEVLAEGQDLASYLQTQPGLFRVYSPSYSLPQQTAAQAQLPLADGVDPLQLSTYVDFMNQATGVPSQGYSVTVPPFANGDPQHDNAAYVPDAKSMGLLNVTFLASEYEINAPGWIHEATFGSTQLYRNSQSMPRAWVQSSYSQSEEITTTAAEVLRLAPNKLLIEGNGPGKLILAEINYPGWQVKVDGAPVQIETWNDLLRSVSLTPGLHRISFEFHPLSLYLGLVACIIGLLLTILGTSHISRNENQ